MSRRQPDAHKRLMLIATTVLLTASVGRWPIIRDAGNVALAVCAVSDLLVVAMIVSDLVTRRRVHASLVWGGSRSSLRSICRRRSDTPTRDVLSWRGSSADFARAPNARSRNRNFARSHPGGSSRHRLRVLLQRDRCPRLGRRWPDDATRRPSAAAVRLRPVSYTHLTLPTICSV